MAMLDDLTEDHLRTGMPRAEVRSLLGAPDKTAASDLWHYELGAFVDCEYLSLRFDAEDRLSRWERWQN